MDETENKKRLQVLRMAEAILTEEKSKRFKAEYQHWIASSDVSWRVSGVKLPVPTASSVPTEAEIVAKALELYRATIPTIPQVVALSAVPSTETTEALAAIALTGASVDDGVPLPELVAPELMPVPEPGTQQVAAPEHHPELILDPVRKIFETPLETTSSFKEMLAGWFQQNPSKQGAV